MENVFGEYLRALLPKFENKRNRMAVAIGITPSRLSRALNGDYPLDIGNCLRLALAAEVAPGEVLRKAGKQDIAELVERLYGQPDATTTPAEREHLARWRVIPAGARQAIDVLMKQLEEAEGAEGMRPRKRR